jgi:outer membrane receptor protein involved in Fe transport
MNRRFLVLVLAGLTAATVTAQPAAPQQLDPTVVTATRAGQPPEQVAFSVKAIESSALRTNPAIMLDGVLRSIPGFTLFRRSDSLSANPTAQGVSLRGLGPSGASRSLVVLDGVPLNDPFGGWVAWTKVPRDGLSRAELVPGGGATAWGNAALGGVVQLLSVPPTTAGARVTGLFGGNETRSIEFSAAAPIEGASVQVSSRLFSTNGFHLVGHERRGAIDIPAANKHRWIQGRVAIPLGTVEATATLRSYRETRNNGTPYQINGTREQFGSLNLRGSPNANFSWNGVAYLQGQTYNQTFSGVNATRSAETPASNQYEVPANAAGLALTGNWQHGGTARTTAGADWRMVEGETRELFTFVAAANDFSRLRIAGGQQDIGGLFLLHDRPIMESVRAVFGGRIDWWNDSEGHRRESDRATGVASRDDHYPEIESNEFSPTAGLVWTPLRSIRIRTNIQQAFRRPTLNELHRPFRVGANVTEANVALKTEKVTSGEVGAEWSPTLAYGTPGRPPFTLGVTAFWNEVRDAVGNVTIARGPGTFPIVGFIAAGAVGRQRLNLDRARVQGLEVSLAWRPVNSFSAHVDYLYNDATVRRASVAPALVGNRLAQVAKSSGSVSASWTIAGKVTIMPRVRWIGRQFEDDENLLTLEKVSIADLSISVPVHRNIELFVNGENLGNNRIETGRSADGLVNIGTPRLFLGGVRGTW